MVCGVEHRVEAFRASLVVAVYLLDLDSVRGTDEVATGHACESFYCLPFCWRLDEV